MNYLNKLLLVFNNMKIRNKLIFTYIIVVLIPVWIVGIYLTNSMRGMVIGRAIEEANINTSRTEQRLNETLRIAAGVSDWMYFDAKLKEITLKYYEDNWDIIKDYSEYVAFKDYLRSYKELDSIRFYVNNQTLLDNGAFIKVTDKIEKQDWYQEAIKGDGRIVWKYSYDEISRQTLLSASRVIKDDRGCLLGVLVININDLYLYSIIKDEPFETIITIGDGLVVNSTRREIQGQIIDIKNTDINKRIHRAEEYNGEKAMIIGKNFYPIKSSTPFSIRTIVPINIILSKANQKSKLGFVIIGISFIISLGFILLFSSLISRRIIILRKEMHKVVSGDFNITKDFKGKDEIGELYQDLNTMIKSIQKLIYEIYDHKLQGEQLASRQKDIQFKMLASQINPHFLYNTLETIRMKAHTNKQPEIAMIVKKLAKLMKRNLAVEDRLVALRGEIELVKDYLGIQKFRFGDKVDYEVNVSCDIENYYVLPLLLQPIVENAFVHGLESKEGRGIIIITIEELNNKIIISVEDDGIGIEENKLIEISEKLSCMDFPSTVQGQSIGLSNVNQRIKLFYGEIYGIRIESQINKGTKVDIFLPPKWRDKSAEASGH